MRRKNRRLLLICGALVLLLGSIGAIAWFSPWQVRVRVGREIQFPQADFAVEDLLHHRDLRDISELLRKQPEMANGRTMNGNSFLMVATDENNPELVKLLLEKGAQVDVMDRSGGTPLHVAGIRGFVEVAGLLLKAGADPDLPDKRGKSFRDVAREDPGLKALLTSAATSRSSDE